MAIFSTASWPSAVVVSATRASVSPDRVRPIDSCHSVARSPTRPSSPSSHATPASPTASALRRTLSGICRSAAFMVSLARAGWARQLERDRHAVANLRHAGLARRRDQAAPLFEQLAEGRLPSDIAPLAMQPG